jgi:integrase
MDTKGLSPSRIRQAHQVLRASLDQAVHDGLIPRNPAVGAKVPVDRTREMLSLTAEHVHEFAAITERHQPGAGTFVTFLAWSGLRWSEAVALRSRPLDLLRNRIPVSHAATEVRGKLIYGPTKTHRSRTIVIPFRIHTFWPSMQPLTSTRTPYSQRPEVDRSARRTSAGPSDCPLSGPSQKRTRI